MFNRDGFAKLQFRQSFTLAIHAVCKFNNSVLKFRNIKLYIKYIKVEVAQCSCKAIDNDNNGKQITFGIAS